MTNINANILIALIFQIEGKGQGVEVYYKDKTIWCTQKAMGMLYDCTPDKVGLCKDIKDDYQKSTRAFTN